MNIMSLQAVALSRKEKLAALKKRKELHDDGSAPNPTAEEDTQCVPTVLSLLATRVVGELY